MANRPLSPHLTDGWRFHWRWGPAMFVSILHRVSGSGLSLVGLATLLCWLSALASGPAAYAKFAAISGTWYGLVILVGLSWAFFTHLMSGLRHFVLDIGAGYELGINKLWSVLAPIFAILLTAAFWAALKLL